MRFCRLGAALACTVGICSAALAQQSPVADTAVFEVAAIKSATGDPSARSGFFTTPGRFTAENVSAAALIQFAFRDRVDDIQNIPNWARNESYTITTTFVSPASDSDVAAMLRNLLVERFHLSFRIEPEERDVLALVRADSAKPLPSRIQPIREDCSTLRPQAPVSPPRSETDLPPACFTRGNGRMINSGGISMEAFSRQLTPQVGRKVIDRTGLTGWYRVLLQYSRPSPGDSAAPEFPEIRTALVGQLGLRLVAQRGTVDVLIVARFDPPSPD